MSELQIRTKNINKTDKNSTIQQKINKTSTKYNRNLIWSS